jgi:hypothetical protein
MASQEYSSYSTMSEAQGFCQYGMIPNEAQDALYDVPYSTGASQMNGNCLLLALDDYTDESDSDDDKPVQRKLETVPSSPAATKRAGQNSNSKSKPYESPASSTDEPDTSCLSSLESDASDKEQDLDLSPPCSVSESKREDVSTDEQILEVPSTQDGASTDETFSILALLKLRHSVHESDTCMGECYVPGELTAQEAPEEIKDAAPAKALRKKTSAPQEGKAKPREAREHRGKPRGGGFDLNRGDESKKLVTSDDSWAAKQAARRCNRTEEPASNENVVRAIKSILNKLTLEKFAPLYEKLLSCGIETTSHLESLVHEVFEKATLQHHFIDMYADLCVLLHKHFTENPVTDDSKASFKKVLLNGCQAFFERHLKPPADVGELDDEEREILAHKYKMRMLGNIRFVGALLVRHMLASKVMFAIMEELLLEPTPESLESLACLLTAIGPEFDTPDWAGRPILTGIFKRVEALSKSSSVSCRVRFLLKDVLELRACHWRDQKPKKVEGPSTLKEVADNQAFEEASATSRKSPSSSGQRSR